ncbi:MAG: hypothetical protein H7Z41_18925 [Cytophagales bacterium]|nr:hypothetical protein [Armatimonadota bacterium]
MRVRFFGLACGASAFRPGALAVPRLLRVRMALSNSRRWLRIVRTSLLINA